MTLPIMGLHLPVAVRNWRAFRDRNGEPAPGRRQQRPASRFQDSSGREIQRPAIQGWACFYEKAFMAGGQIRYIKAGAFADTIQQNTQPKRLLIDHDERREVGSSSTGLEFASCPEGLAFRMPLDGNPNNELIFDNVNENRRPCVSVGMRAVWETRTADGIKYEYCDKATLDEISLVSEGAVENTYCRIVDLDDENPYLWLACRSSSFARDKAVANVCARAKRIADALRALK